MTTETPVIARGPAQDMAPANLEEAGEEEDPKIKKGSVIDGLPASDQT